MQCLNYSFLGKGVCIVLLLTVILGWETNNKYLVKNSMGQQVFYIAEENDCCNRQCCGPMRSFVLHVQDNMGQEVMTLSRPLKCASCCCPCCLQEVIHISVWEIYMFSSLTLTRSHIHLYIWARFCCMRRTGNK